MLKNSVFEAPSSDTSKAHQVLLFGFTFSKVTFQTVVRRMAEALSRPDLLPDLVRHLDRSGELAAISAVLAAVPSPNSTDPRFNDSYSSSGSTLAAAAPQIVFRPKISVAEVADTNTDLARLAMEEPASFNRLLQVVILKLARQQEVGLAASQVVVVPRLASLLPFYEHEVTAERCLGGLGASPRLWSLRRAVLVAVSEKVKYVSSAAYRCAGEACGWAGEESVYVKVFGPVGEGGRLPRGQECLGCGAAMEEQFHRRDVSERVTGRVVTATSNVTAVFRQEEAALLHLGGEYELIFTLVHERDGADRRVMVEVRFDGLHDVSTGWTTAVCILLAAGSDIQANLRFNIFSFLLLQFLAFTRGVL